MKIEIEQRVLDFARKLPPQPRRAVRLAIRDLAEGTGDIKILQGEFAGFYRLRVMTYRVIFHYVRRDGALFLRCVFAERRDVVYPGFQELLGEGRGIV